MADEQKEDIFFVDENKNSESKNNTSNTKFCTHCGAKIDKDAVICTYCGCKAVEEVAQKAPIINMVTDYNQSKKLIGFFAGFFLGIIGLIIGVCIYPERTFARDTFVRGCVMGIFIPIGIGVLIFIIALIVGATASVVA